MAKAGRPRKPFKERRRVITLTADAYKTVVAGKELANLINADASAALPMCKSGQWTLSEIVKLAVEDWMRETKKVHNRIVTKMEKKTGFKVPEMKV